MAKRILFYTIMGIILLYCIGLMYALKAGAPQLSMENCQDRSEKGCMIYCQECQEEKESGSPQAGSCPLKLGLYDFPRPFICAKENNVCVFTSDKPRVFVCSFKSSINNISKHIFFGPID